MIQAHRQTHQNREKKDEDTRCDKEHRKTGMEIR